MDFFLDLVTEFYCQIEHKHLNDTSHNNDLKRYYKRIILTIKACVFTHLIRLHSPNVHEVLRSQYFLTTMR